MLSLYWLHQKFSAQVSHRVKENRDNQQVPDGTFSELH